MTTIRSYRYGRSVSILVSRVCTVDYADRINCDVNAVGVLPNVSASGKVKLPIRFHFARRATRKYITQ